MAYTIHGDSITYVVQPSSWGLWSKPAEIKLGEKLKYAMQKNNLYLLDDTGKEHKYEIIETRIRLRHQ